MADETVSRGPAPFPARALVAGLAMAGLAGAFAWHAPERNGWAASALAAALVLDGLARMVGALVARRAGPMPRLAGMPSVVLAFGPGAGLGAGAFALLVLVWPAGFALAASALAGLVAMGALARLALARILLRGPREPEA